MTVFSRILGCGSYLPAKILTNDDLSQKIDTSDEWITSRTGIRERRIADEKETSSSMAIEASKKALEFANVKAEAIDLIIVATCTPDRMFPSTACLIQQAFGLRTIPAFDVASACAGFAYALSIADQFIRNKTVKTVLVVGSEVMSRTLDWSDRGTCVLFGDGAGAMILTADNQPGIYSTHIHADGCFQDILYVPNDLAAPSLKTDSPYLKMKGGEVYKVAVRELSSVIDEALKANGFTYEDIDWLIPHQANIRIIQSVAKHLQLPMEKVIITVDKHANTSAASIPLAFDEGVRSGKIRRGHRVLLEGVGGGMTWGAALATF